MWAERVEMLHLRADLKATRSGPRQSITFWSDDWSRTTCAPFKRNFRRRQQYFLCGWKEREFRREYRSGRGGDSISPCGGCEARLRGLHLKACHRCWFKAWCQQEPHLGKSSVSPAWAPLRGYLAARCLGAIDRRPHENIAVICLCLLLIPAACLRTAVRQCVHLWREPRSRAASRFWSLDQIWSGSAATQQVAISSEAQCGLCFLHIIQITIQRLHKCF